MQCLFCSIVEKKFPSKEIYEDKKVFAFHDVRPQAPIHILIVPKKHVSTVLDIETADNELMGHMFQVANKIARDQGIAEKGFRLVLNCNRQAGQTVFHVHLHLLGGRLMKWPPG